MNNPQVRNDMKLEIVVIPVSDVDRAKHFYGGLGWRLDAAWERRSKRFLDELEWYARAFAAERARGVPY